MSPEREQRYESIFHEVPIALLEEDWTEVHAELATLKANGITDFARYFDEQPHAAGALAAKVGLLDANKFFLDFVEIGSQAELTAFLPKIFDEETWPAFVRELVVFAQGESYFETEVFLRSLSGVRRHVMLSATKLEGPGEGRVRVVVSFIDISRRKEMEETLKTLNAELARANAELQRANAELKRSNAELERFAYMASHDLQEPLRMVESYTGLLERHYSGQLDTRADKYIRFAADGAQRMRSLINGLLTLARVGVHGKPLAPTDCNQLLRGQLRVLAARIRESGAVITHDPLPTVQADASQLAQVFQNLIANAIKFRGEAPPRIHVSAARKDDAWVISVADNGIGIAEEHRHEVFDVFRRLHGHQAYPGTGIGLALARSIVERHHGRIWVDANPGGGATFRFTLPAAHAASASAPNRAPAPMPNPAPARAPHGERG